jgi:hypothetical protein
MITMSHLGLARPMSYISRCIIQQQQPFEKEKMGFGF